MVKTRILVVDDEVNIIRFLRANLEARGYEVLVAVNGVEALQTVEMELPDLVILDIKMPEMNGFEVCHRIREWSQIPVIMLSARGDEDLGAGIPRDVGGLRRFQLRADGRVDETGALGRPAELEEVRVVLHEERDAVAGREPQGAEELCALVRAHVELAIRDRLAARGHDVGQLFWI